jgi:hypothetical protein
MLKRTQIRRYLMALLYSEEVHQSASCDQGPLYVNCDGQGPDVFDSYTHQMFEDTEASYGLKPDSIALEFSVSRVGYSLSQTKVDRALINVAINIIAHAESGSKRQDMLDDVEERILYRILSYACFMDAQTNEELKSFMRLKDNTAFSIDSSDDSSFDGNYTVRELTFTINTRECVEKTGCDDVPICFDFPNKGVCND